MSFRKKNPTRFDSGGENSSDVKRLMKRPALAMTIFAPKVNPMLISFIEPLTIHHTMMSFGLSCTSFFLVRSQKKKYREKYQQISEAFTFTTKNVFLFSAARIVTFDRTSSLILNRKRCDICCVFFYLIFLSLFVVFSRTLI